MTEPSAITPAMRRAALYLSLDHASQQAQFPRYYPNSTMQDRLVAAGLAEWVDSGAPHLTDAGRAIL